MFSCGSTQATGRLPLEAEAGLKHTELVRSAWLPADDGFSLPEVLLVPASSGLCGTVPGLEGTAGAEELKLLAPPPPFCCLSLGQG